LDIPAITFGWKDLKLYTTGGEEGRQMDTQTLIIAALVIFILGMLTSTAMNNGYTTRPVIVYQERDNSSTAGCLVAALILVALIIAFYLTK